MLEWIANDFGKNSRKIKEPVIRIRDYGLLLNKAALELLKNTEYVNVGIDLEQKKLCITPSTVEKDKNSIKLTSNKINLTALSKLLRKNNFKTEGIFIAKFDEDIKGIYITADDWRE